MKATKVQIKAKIIGCIMKDGSILLKSDIPMIKEKGYHCHSIRETVALVSGNLDYWLNQGAEPIYEGDKIVIQF